MAFFLKFPHCGINESLPHLVLLQSVKCIVLSSYNSKKQSNILFVFILQLLPKYNSLLDGTIYSPDSSTQAFPCNNVSFQYLVPTCFWSFFSCRFPLTQTPSKNLVMQQKAPGSPAWCRGGLAEVKNTHPPSLLIAALWSNALLKKTLLRSEDESLSGRLPRQRGRRATRGG